MTEGLDSPAPTSELSSTEIDKALESLRGEGVKIFEFDASKFDYRDIQHQPGLPNDLRTLFRNGGLSDQTLIRGVAARTLRDVASNFTDHPEFDSIFAYTLEDLRKLTKFRRMRDAWRSFRDATDRNYVYPDEAYVHSPLLYAGFGNEQSVLLFYNQEAYEAAPDTGDFEKYKRVLKPGVDRRGLVGVCRVIGGNQPTDNAGVRPLTQLSS